jgi:KEOPS complex subunit Pcc1
VHSADLRFQYQSPEAAALVADAVAGELGKIGGDRATATLTAEDATIQVEIDAADLVSLRAGVNTWEGLLAVAERSAEVGRTGEIL